MNQDHRSAHSVLKLEMFLIPSRGSVLEIFGLGQSMNRRIISSSPAPKCSDYIFKFFQFCSWVFFDPVKIDGLVIVKAFVLNPLDLSL